MFSPISNNLWILYTPPLFCKLRTQNIFHLNNYDYAGDIFGDDDEEEEYDTYDEDEEEAEDCDTVTSIDDIQQILDQCTYEP